MPDEQTSVFQNLDSIFFVCDFNLANVFKCLCDQHKTKSLWRSCNCYNNETSRDFRRLYNSNLISYDNN